MKTSDPKRLRASFLEQINILLQEDERYLAACYSIVEYKSALGIYDNDPDFMPFLAVRAALADLPFSTPPTKWSQSERQQYHDDILSLERWAKELTLAHARAFAKRFG